MTATALDVVVVFEDGVLKPEGNTRFAGVLQDSKRYKAHLEPVPAEAPVVNDDPTGWKTARALKGCITSTVSDAARNHDKYLYDAD